MAFGETVAPDETERFAGYAEEIASIQQNRVARGGKLERALHVKQHLGAVGELVVKAPESARNGVFSMSGKSWPVYVRFSNGGSQHQADKVPDVRGFALKLVGVRGQKLIKGLESELTQDFLFIDSPALPFSTPEEFMQFVRIARRGPTKLVPGLISSYGLGRGLGIIWGSVTKTKVKSYATHTFHTGAPIAFGRSAAKLSLVPVPSSPPTPAAAGPDFLRQDLETRLKAGPLSWTLRAQLFVDQTATPIEDTAVTWTAPWIDLATLTLPQQDTTSARGVEISELVNQLSFDPWHATEEHRPLGAMMRARAATYGASVMGRKAAPEPKSVLTPAP
jgi:Catalase